MTQLERIEAKIDALLEAWICEHTNTKHNIRLVNRIGEVAKQDWVDKNTIENEIHQMD
jgi:hypothetical protein